MARLDSLAGAVRRFIELRLEMNDAANVLQSTATTARAGYVRNDLHLVVGPPLSCSPRPSRSRLSAPSLSLSHSLLSTVGPGHVLADFKTSLADSHTLAGPPLY